MSMMPAQSEHLPAEVVDYETAPAMAPMETTALEAITRAEVDVQIATARRYPRDIDRFLKNSRAMACLNEDVAESCYYALPRGKDKKTGEQMFVEGPSIHFANILASNFGNLRVASRVTQIRERQVTAEAAAVDLEANNGASVEAHRSIWGNYGRYNDDMINVTCQAAVSIARRNAILAIVPKPYWWQAYDAARRTALGETKSFEQRRKAALDWAHAIGVRDSEIWAVFGIEGEASMTPRHLELMSGFKTAIKDKDATVDSIFRPSQAESIKAKTKAGKLPEKKPDLRAELNAKLDGTKPPREPGDDDDEQDGVTNA